MAIYRKEKLKAPEIKVASTHDYLVQRARNWLVAGGGCRFAIAEFKTWFTTHIPDALGFLESGLTVEVECKASRSDFHADKRKPSRQNGKLLAHYQYYLCEKGLITLEDLSESDWGLLYLRGPDAVSIIKYPERPLDLVFGKYEKYEQAEDYARYVMTSLLFRAEKKGLIPRLNKAFDKIPLMPLHFSWMKYETFGDKWNPKYVGAM